MPCIGAKSHSGAGHFALMAVSIFPLLPGFSLATAVKKQGWLSQERPFVPQKTLPIPAKFDLFHFLSAYLNLNMQRG